jgi:hypothetical protein
MAETTVVRVAAQNSRYRLVRSVRRLRAHVTNAARFSGDSFHMRAHSDNPDDNGPGVDRLADGGGLEAGPLHALHRRKRTPTAPVQHARTARMLPI